MPWRCTALEDLDDDHATAAAWTSRLAGIDGGIGGLGLAGFATASSSRARAMLSARAPLANRP